MIAPTYIQKPVNWQDFESLCKKLWGEIWGCSDTIKKNGRSGQAQHGVDVYGIPKGETMYYGIQCKGKDDYTQSQLTKDEIDAEIEKAKAFKPDLKLLIFATSANKDAVIEEYIRIKNIQHLQEGLFGVDVFSWEDIADLIDERKVVKDWYVRNIQYKTSTDISITFDGETSKTIAPVYIRERVKYKYTPKPTIEELSLGNPLLGQYIQQLASAKELTKILPVSINPPMLFGRGRYKTNYTWCDIFIAIQNIGDIAIDDYKLYIQFDSAATEDIDDCLRLINDPLIGDRVHINNQRLNAQEVFESKDYTMAIEYIPKERTLVPIDRKRFKIRIKPKQGATEINATWLFVSREFSKHGELKVVINPIYEDKETIIEVESEEQLKEESIKIYPKIVEE